MKLKKYRRSTWIVLALLVYITATAIYVLPHNLMETSMEKLCTLFFSYVIAFLLWIVLRKKENKHHQASNEKSINN
jgi:cytosine/uracil/thiamine/allantoin permease